jgi:hypothetical protein
MGLACLASIPAMITKKICYVECFQGHSNRHQTNGRDHASAVVQNIVGHVEAALGHSFCSFSPVIVTMPIPRSLTFREHSTLNCANRWTHTNFSTFHAIQILTVIIKKLI